MDYIQKTISAYDNAPEKYSSATGDMINQIEIDIMLKFLPNKKLPILDVGCANGRDCKVFTDIGLKPVGIDMSSELLKRARQDYPALEFHMMDIRKLKFPDNYFGGVWCNAVLLHLNDSDLALALGEIQRVLVPGGVIAVSFKEGEGQKEFVESFSVNLSRFYNFKTEAKLNKLLVKSGLQIRQSHILNERERFGPKKRDLNWVWSFATKPSKS